MSASSSLSSMLSTKGPMGIPYNGYKEDAARVLSSKIMSSAGRPIRVKSLAS